MAWIFCWLVKIFWILLSSNRCVFSYLDLAAGSVWKTCCAFSSVAQMRWKGCDWAFITDVKNSDARADIRRDVIFFKKISFRTKIKIQVYWITLRCWNKIQRLSIWKSYFLLLQPVIYVRWLLCSLFIKFVIFPFCTNFFSIHLKQLYEFKTKVDRLKFFTILCLGYMAYFAGGIYVYKFWQWT